MKNSRRWINRIILVVAILVFLCAAAKLVSFGWNYWLAARQYRQLEDQYLRVTDTEQADDETTQQEGDTQTRAADGVTYRVDFTALQKGNPDAVGWIRFDNLSISYPIMQGDDNEYYLTHTYEGAVLTAASIFMDNANQADFSDQNTFIYGHNMKDQSMFGRLNQYENEDFYRKNSYFYIYTPEYTYRYDIFSCYLADVSEEADSFYINFADTQDYEDYLEKIQKRAAYDTGVAVSSEDKMVTLMTCNSAGHAYRFLVHARLAKSWAIDAGEEK